MSYKVAGNYSGTRNDKHARALYSFCNMIKTDNFISLINKFVINPYKCSCFAPSIFKFFVFLNFLL